MKSLLFLLFTTLPGSFVAYISQTTFPRLFNVQQVYSTGTSDSILRNRLRRIYIAELGVREATGHNDGSRVTEYLMYTGVKTGNPWCCAFVCFCLGKAKIPNPRTAYCPEMFPSAKVIWTRNKITGKSSGYQTSLQHTISQPSSGDVFGIYFPEKGRIAHVGFVDTWGEKYFITIEGNTNEAGSREGDGVFRKRRLISSIYKIARFIPPE